MRVILELPLGPRTSFTTGKAEMTLLTGNRLCKFTIRSFCLAPVPIASVRGPLFCPPLHLGALRKKDAA